MIFPRMHRYQQMLKNNEGTSNTVDCSRVKVCGQNIEVNVFFDGTMNNYYNSKDFRDSNGRVNKGVSYTNGYSNVAIMWRGFNENQTDRLAFYIDGAGTIRHKSDTWNMLGSAFAWGKTGIEARVQEAFDLIKTYPAIQESEGIALKINVYGFSRGAAYARYFVHLAKTQPQKFGGTIKTVEINFVGIFDTVPAEGGNAENDVSEFHLKLEHGKKVVHLTAKNEYRANFRLTNIKAAVARGVGLELELPGAHSDIGGGYEEVAPESHEFYGPASGDGSLRPFFLNQGFYNDGDMGRYHTAAYGYNTLKGQRAQILSSYQYVSLAIMKYCAQKYAEAK